HARSSGTRLHPPPLDERASGAENGSWQVVSAPAVRALHLSRKDDNRADIQQIGVERRTAPMSQVRQSMRTSAFLCAAVGVMVITTVRLPGQAGAARKNPGEWPT